MTAKVKLSELSLSERVVTIEDADELAALIEIAQAALKWCTASPGEESKVAYHDLIVATNKVDP